jgi:hypothetical protein
MTSSKSWRGKLGRIEGGFLIAFLALWLTMLWSYMAPVPAFPASLNAPLVRFACTINSSKIPHAVCAAEIKDAANGRVRADGWWRFGGGVAGTGFAVVILVQQSRRGSK